MSTREQLEAALRARPDDATLAVYADLLQAQGDPRGELIALDLTPPDVSTNALEVRRGQLLEKWLGEDIDLQFDAERQLWYAGDLATSHATFHCGFVSLVAVDWDLTSDRVVPKVLGSPVSEYLRELSLSGATAMLAPLVDTLASRSRPWLQRLSITRPSHDTALLLSGVRTAALAHAAPYLEVLELAGDNLGPHFTHPTLRTLVVDGTTAIDLLDGPPLPAVHTIDFRFEDDREARPQLFSPARFPTLRRLDFSREEPGALRLYDMIGAIAVAPQLTHLVLPAIRSEDDRALVQAAIDRMPLLREVEIARAYTCHAGVFELRHATARFKLPAPYPWRPRETLNEVFLEIDGFLIHLAELVDALEAHRADMPERHYEIWVRFWSMFRETFVEHAFNAADLVDALTTLTGDSNLASLRDELEANIAQRPEGYLASIRWSD